MSEEDRLTTGDPPDRGWAFPNGARKAHYFIGTLSLCRRYGLYFGPLYDDKHDSPDNCVKCKRLRADEGEKP